MIDRSSWVCALAAFVFVATQAHAQVLIVRAKGPQIDDAVQALKAELASSSAAALQAGVEVVDESAGADAVAQKVAAMKPVVVVGVGARAAQVALKQDAPAIVHCMVLQDAESFDGPKSAGVSVALPARRQLQALKSVVPSAKRVGLLYDPKVNARFADEAKSVAASLGLSLVAQPIASSAAALPALDDVSGKIDALSLAPDATVVTKELVTFLVARAFEKKLPVLAFSESLAKLGLLAALVPSYAQNGKLCGALVERIAAGEKASSLHGAIAMTGSLVVNVSTARRIGVAVPADVLKPPTEIVGQ